MINTAINGHVNFGDATLRAFAKDLAANVENLYNLRNKMRIINESDVLINLQSRSYLVNVPVGSTDPMKITMAYTDPMGSPGATQARINDITLRVTSPAGTVYWGNVGLAGSGMWSTSGGVANTVDTVENVFIQSPASGTWTIQVIGSAINQDARSETPSVVDADFALVASGVTPAVPTAANVSVAGKVITVKGSPLRGALIKLVANDGSERSAFSNSFGYFKIDEVAVGQTYIALVTKPKMSFEPASIAINVLDDIDDLHFYGSD